MVQPASQTAAFSPTGQVHVGLTCTSPMLRTPPAVFPIKIYRVRHICISHLTSSFLIPNLKNQLWFDLVWAWFWFGFVWFFVFLWFVVLLVCFCCVFFFFFFFALFCFALLLFVLFCCVLFRFVLLCRKARTS